MWRFSSPELCAVSRQIAELKAAIFDVPGVNFLLLRFCCG
jgi:hypothetical protein